MDREIYDIKVRIKTLPTKKWSAVKRRYAGQIGSLLELLRGDLSDNVMEVVTDRRNGLFPLPGEISFDCDCRDWADMCKHVASVLYGVGARLDEKPALLFQLRGVNHEELIDAEAEIAVPTKTRGASKRLAGDDLGDVLGIDLADEPKTGRESTAKANGKQRKKTSTSKRLPSAKQKSASKRTTRKAAKTVDAGRRKVKRVVTRKLAKKTPKKKPRRALEPVA